ncbi:tetratricopeptide repeat protein [Sedimenticola sp.]|uniref:tetratricopeptide repeat protein n=2 Tax=Sedimenticola sp. TaxID=1940285 RepID=UPI003D0E1E12
MKRFCKPLLLASSLLLSMAAPAGAQEVRSAARWMQMAVNGDLEANGVVCDGLVTGRNGFPVDRPKAFSFCKTFADKSGGIAEANFLVGVFYEKGWGVAQSDAEALERYRLAGDAGWGDLPDAQAALGRFYYQGRGGLKKDAAKAAHYWRLAAKQNNAYAQLNLAGLYHAGHGVPKDIEEAKRLYRLAARNGDPNAKAALQRLEKR